MDRRAAGFLICSIGTGSLVRNCFPVGLIHPVNQYQPKCLKPAATFSYYKDIFPLTLYFYLTESSKQGKRSDGNLPTTRLHLVGRLLFLSVLVVLYQWN